MNRFERHIDMPTKCRKIVNNIRRLCCKALGCQFIEPVRIEFKALVPGARMPHRKRESDACYDISSVENVTIPPGTAMNINTGIVAVAPVGYVITVEGRSSLFKSRIIPERGIIDATYTGPLLVYLRNDGTEPYVVEAGHRIAQISVHRVVDAFFESVDEISPEYSHRGELGWGSSGK